MERLFPDSASYIQATLDIFLLGIKEKQPVARMQRSGIRGDTQDTIFTVIYMHSPGNQGKYPGRQALNCVICRMKVRHMTQIFVQSLSASKQIPLRQRL